MWWMLALALNAQGPQPTATDARSKLSADDAASLRAELADVLAKNAATPAPANPLPLKRTVDASSSSVPASAPVVGSAIANRSSPATSWVALALIGAAAGGAALWRKRKKSRSSLLTIRETAPLGRNKLLALVDIGGRRLLIGVTDQGMQLLANDAQPAEPLAMIASTPDAPPMHDQARMRFDDHLPPLEGEELRKKLAARFA
ncbi:MAG: flagellar biosynthetic protein FliO [Deltaproteobacteria bacterium]|nr:flagellar biosynthetic protein FliO [Deltaproteobacteria bacterium]